MDWVKAACWSVAITLLGMGHDAGGGDIGRAGVGGEHDLVLVDLALAEHHVVDRLGPDVDALDLLHVVHTADGSDLDAAERPAAITVAGVVVDGAVAHGDTDQRNLVVDQAANHDLSGLTVVHVAAGLRVDHFDQKIGIDVVQHAGLLARADAALAREHVVDPGLGRAELVVERHAPLLLQALEVGEAAAENRLQARRRRHGLGNRGEVGEVRRGRLYGVGPETLHHLELARNVIVVHRIDREAIALEADQLDAPAAQQGDWEAEEDAIARLEPAPAQAVVRDLGRALPLGPGLGVDLDPLALPSHDKSG